MYIKWEFSDIFISSHLFVLTECKDEVKPDETLEVKIYIYTNVLKWNNLNSSSPIRPQELKNQPDSLTTKRKSRKSSEFLGRNIKIWPFNIMALFYLFDISSFQMFKRYRSYDLSQCLLWFRTQIVPFWMLVIAQDTNRDSLE